MQKFRNLMQILRVDIRKFCNIPLILCVYSQKLRIFAKAQSLLMKVSRLTTKVTRVFTIVLRKTATVTRFCKSLASFRFVFNFLPDENKLHGLSYYRYVYQFCFVKCNYNPVKSKYVFKYLSI